VSQILDALGLEPRIVLVQAISFVLLYLLLKRFLFGPIMGMMDRRNEEIAARLRNAEEHEKQMHALREQYERRIAQIESEARDMIQEATRRAHEARDEIIAEARAKAQEMIARAQTEIERELDKARIALRGEIAELAVSGARQILDRELRREDHERFVEQYIKEIEERRS